MGATRNTGYLENLIQYDASDNVAIATSVNPSYKVTLGGSLFGTSATFNVGSATTVLGLTGNGDGATIASITNTNTGTAGRSSFQVTSDSSTAHYFASSSTNVSTATGGRASTAGIFTASGDTAGGLAFLARNPVGVITFHTGGNTERVRIAANGAATFSSSIAATSATFSGKLSVSQSSTDFVAEFINTASLTPYGVRIKDAASAANNYPLFQVSNNAGTTEYFRVNSGTGTATFSSSVTATKGFFSSNGASDSTTGLLANASTNDNTTYAAIFGSLNAGYRMVVRADGNVGIGTTSPQAKLEVSGAVMVSGADAVAIANRGALDFSSGNTRLLSFGANTSTKGGFDFLTLTSNGTGGSAMTITSGGNVGIGVTPSAWDTAQVTVLELGTIGNYFAGYIGSSTIYLGNNSYLDSTGWKYARTAAPSQIDMGGGAFRFRNAASGTAGNALTWSTRMFISSDGNVGIGTTSPNASDWNASATLLHIYQNSTNGSILKLESSNAAGVVAVGNNQMQIATTTDDPMIFYTNSAERMRITSGGNVIIGNTTAYGGLTISDFTANDGNDSLSFFYRGTTGSHESLVKFYDFRGQVNAAIGNNLEDDGSGTQKARLVFKTSYNGTPSERMRITSGGEVYIAGTTDQGAYNLQCNGTGVWGAGAYVNGSDIALKENIKPILSGLDFVSKMKPVSYTYIQSYSKDRSLQTGFIAQDLLEVFKDQEWIEGIVKMGNQHYNVAYQNLIPILTKAIQEQQAQIEELKSKLS